MVEVREKNPVLKELIVNLFRQERPVWKATGRLLNRPKRQRHEVNLTKIERNAKAKDTLIVPGIVLGSGELSKAVNVAALKFSGRAREKIEKAGGKCFSIEELLGKNPEGKGVRIMG
jgi:large subunit ribosomal protein L18e